MKAYGRRRVQLSQLCHAGSGGARELTFTAEFALPYTWIVTKSQPHADSVVIQLRRQGFSALAIPCIEHQWRDWPELRRIGAAGAAFLFVTSRAAAARIDVPQGSSLVAAHCTDHFRDARSTRHPRRAHRDWRRAGSRAGGARFTRGAGWRGCVLPNQRRGAASARTPGRCGHAFAAAARAHPGRVFDGRACESRPGTRGAARRDDRARRWATASGALQPSKISRLRAASSSRPDRRCWSAAPPSDAGGKPRPRNGAAPSSTTRRRHWNGRCASWNAGASVVDAAGTR